MTDEELNLEPKTPEELDRFIAEVRRVRPFYERKANRQLPQANVVKGPWGKGGVR